MIMFKIFIVVVLAVFTFHIISAAPALNKGSTVEESNSFERRFFMISEDVIMAHICSTLLNDEVISTYNIPIVEECKKSKNKDVTIEENTLERRLFMVPEDVIMAHICSTLLDDEVISTYNIPIVEEKPEAPTTNDSISKLKNTLELLEKREKYLEKKIDNELNVAKTNATKNKKVALMALKRKKAYEVQVEKIMGSRMTIETQVLALENASVNLEAMKAMKSGSDAMKSIHGKMDIDTVDDTMDSIREQMDIANEIGDAISQPVGFGADFDDDELAAELEEMEQEDLDAQLLDMNTVPTHTMPDIPDTVPVDTTPTVVSKKSKARSAEEEELEALALSMAM